MFSFVFLPIRWISNGVDVVFSVTDFECLDHLGCGSQWLDRLLPKIGQHESLIALAVRSRKATPLESVSQRQSLMIAAFLARERFDDPYR